MGMATHPRIVNAEFWTSSVTWREKRDFPTKTQGLHSAGSTATVSLQRDDKLRVWEELGNAYKCK